MIDQSVTKWQYRFGLIGKRLDYSFSPDYFHGIFERAGLLESHKYTTWEFSREQDVVDFLSKGRFDGCNVTIPYKMIAAEQCDVLVGFAAQIRAVNTIKRVGRLLIGYNTDVYGVLQTLEKSFLSIATKRSSLRLQAPNVLILGSGGASRAVGAACNFLKWPTTIVSRTVRKNHETYESIRTGFHLSDFDIIINSTPLGMAENADVMPDIEIGQLNADNFVFDVIYNPRKTLLLKRAEEAGSRIMNGEIMLHEQANLAWRIWNLSQ